MDAFKAALNLTVAPSAQRNHIEAAAKIEAKYRDAVKAETSEVVFTPEGRKKMTRRFAIPALRELDELLAKVVSIQQSELRAATDVAVRAMNEFAPPYSREPWGAIFDAELAKSLRANPSLVALMAEAADNGAAIPGEYVDVARAALRAPRALTGVTVKQQNGIVSYLTGGDLVREALEQSNDARMMVRNCVTRIASDAEIRLPELASLHRVLAELLAAGAGELGKPRADAPNIKNIEAVSSTVPLVTGDKLNDGFNAEAVA
jgi:hypothetical protein